MEVIGLAEWMWWVDVDYVVISVVLVVVIVVMCACCEDCICVNLWR